MSKTLKPGDTVPDITLYDQHKTKTALKDLIGQPLVIYFYPKNNTRGCTAEACSFRDSYEDFAEAGAKVIGISGDSTDSHKKFEQKHGLNFTLLSDSQRIAEKAFGVERDLFGLIPGRVTFIFNEKGELIKEFNSARHFTQHITEALDALKKLKA